MSLIESESFVGIPHYAIAGYGRIGRKVTRMLIENGNRVTVFDQYIKKLEFEHENLTFL